VALSLRRLESSLLVMSTENVTANMEQKEFVRSVHKQNNYSQIYKGTLVLVTSLVFVLGCMRAFHLLSQSGYSSMGAFNLVFLKY
jgi:hypothetical protein